MGAGVSFQYPDEPWSCQSTHVRDHRNQSDARGCGLTGEELGRQGPEGTIGATMAQRNEGERNDGKGWVSQKRAPGKTKTHDERGDGNVERSLTGAIRMGAVQLHAHNNDSADGTEDETNAEVAHRKERFYDKRGPKGVTVEARRGEQENDSQLPQRRMTQGVANLHPTAGLASLSLRR